MTREEVIPVAGPSLPLTVSANTVVNSATVSTQTQEQATLKARAKTRVTRKISQVCVATNVSSTCREATVAAPGAVASETTQDRVIITPTRNRTASCASVFLRPDFILCGVDLHTCKLAHCISNSNNKGVILTHSFQALVPKTRIALSSAARRILNTPNAGGTSIWSEVMSFEIVSALFNAILLRTEMEIEYLPGSKITDYSINLFGKSIGISVTRAMKYKGTFTEEDGLRLLNKKLFGVIESSRCVIEEHSWERQILHIFAEKDYIADILRECLSQIDQELLSNTIVIVTVCKNAPWLFYNNLPNACSAS